MNARLVLLLVICSLASTAYGISCKTCWSLDAVSCNGTAMNCTSGQVCVAAYSLTTIGTTSSSQYSISCGAPSQCYINGSLTFDYGRVRTATTCCNTSNCDPILPTVPAVITQKNGLTCHACSSDSTNYCYTGTTVDCTGDEVKCGRMARSLTGTVTKTDALRGCATRTFCDTLGNQTTTIQGLNVDMKMFCTDGARGLHSGSLFLAAAAILLTKLLF